ncbi:hypothetical protein HPB50_019857 [Hyalomma asiaticum]|uniref:Uncharacterized protein n=1 Tax=Hyalomma asiaticum TaxID=266040 RepID=A0ACB7RK76_HYAAI|nr:hypothetical protein HPB50_019857 [Hyalomma asiaticum]
MLIVTGAEEAGRARTPAGFLGSTWLAFAATSQPGAPLTRPSVRACVHYEHLCERVHALACGHWPSERPEDCSGVRTCVRAGRNERRYWGGSLEGKASGTNASEGKEASLLTHLCPSYLSSPSPILRVVQPPSDASSPIRAGHRAYGDRKQEDDEERWCMAAKSLPACPLGVFTSAR